MKICDLFNPQVKTKLNDKKNITKNAEFPSPKYIYTKDIVSEADPKYTQNKKYSENDEIGIKDTVTVEKSEFINNEKTDKKSHKEDLKNLLRNKNNDKMKVEIAVMTNANSTSRENISVETKFERNNSDLSDSPENKLNADNTPFKEKRKSIFIKKCKSRFDFILNEKIEEKEEGMIIPEYISDIISLKTSTHFYLKNIEINEFVDNTNKLNIEEWQKISTLSKQELSN